MKLNCTKCAKPMTIDEANGQEYICKLEADGVTVDVTTVQHVICPKE